MTTASEAARLDPWCLVPLADGGDILFGYALHHPRTGGLAWTASSQVVALGKTRMTARTRSGRHYRLGRRFDPGDVGAEGEEARLAFALLLGNGYEDVNGLHDTDQLWLAAQKAARHLQVARPARTPAAVNAFLTRHQAAYVALRRQAGLC